MADRVEGVIRIDNPEVDVDAIVARIRENLSARDPLEVDTAALLRRFGGDLGQPTAQDLDYAIECLRLVLETPIPSQRIRPIRGPKDKLLNRLRRPLHDLVRFYVDAQALTPTRTWVRYSGPDAAPVTTDGPHPETSELVAGWYLIDVESYERALELAAYVSSEPGPGGEPLYEWIDIREVMS